MTHYTLKCHLPEKNNNKASKILNLHLQKCNFYKVKQNPELLLNDML